MLITVIVATVAAAAAGAAVVAGRDRDVTAIPLPVRSRPERRPRD